MFEILSVYTKQINISGNPRRTGVNILSHKKISDAYMLWSRNPPALQMSNVDSSETALINFWNQFLSIPAEMQIFLFKIIFPPCDTPGSAPSLAQLRFSDLRFSQKLSLPLQIANTDISLNIPAGYKLTSSLGSHYS